MCMRQDDVINNSFNIYRGASHWPLNYITACWWDVGVEIRGVSSTSLVMHIDTPIT